MIPHVILIELAEKYQTAHIGLLTKKKNSYMYSRPLYINFITMACCRFKSFILFILLDHAFSISN
jgi:hypothetical protein